MLEFERMCRSKERILLIGIYWIGFTINEYGDLQDHLKDSKDAKENGFNVTEEGDDGSVFVPHYEMTSLGQPICINEYAT